MKSGVPCGCGLLERQHAHSRGGGGLLLHLGAGEEGGRGCKGNSSAPRRMLWPLAQVSWRPALWQQQHVEGLVARGGRVGVFLLHVCYSTQVYPVGMYAQLHSLLVHDTQAGRQCSSGRLGTRLVVACPQQCVCGSGCFVTCTAVVCEHLSSPVSAAFWACIHATACMHVRMCV